MGRLTRVVGGLLVVGLAATPAVAQVVTVEFEARLALMQDPLDLFDVDVGDIVTGRYVYELTEGDKPDPTTASYPFLSLIHI